jgi:TetR/AcrR family transcriptional repressor of mexJK operon
MTDSARVQKSVRESSTKKRAAILAAARELFARNGVDRVSMDAVSAEAGVSKATVYEYFGDKRRLFLAILSEASRTLTDTGQKVLERHLGEDADIMTVEQLEKALRATMIELAATVHSVSYAAVFGLVAQQRLINPSSSDDLSTEWLESALADRLAHFTRQGLLDAPDSRVAATHLAALTLLLAYNEQPDPATADPQRLQETMANGTRAFIRAYRSADHESM